MSNIAVRNLEVKDTTTFTEIFDVYMDALEGTGTNHNYEKVVARDSLSNLAEFLDKVGYTPLVVETWGKYRGKRNRKKHE